MADNAQKTWLQKTLSDFTNNKTGAKQQQNQKTMPCTVVSIQKQFVTVKFEVQSNFTLPNITIPVQMNPYYRIPIQVGDKGYAVPNDFYLGGQSGQGGGTANLVPKSNLSSLVFHHVSGTEYGDVDLNACTVQGPNGAVLQAMDKSTSITVLPGGTIKIKGNVEIEGSITTTGGGGTMTASGDIKTTGAVTAGHGTGDEINVQSHTHNGGGIPAPDPGS